MNYDTLRLEREWCGPFASIQELWELRPPQDLDAESATIAAMWMAGEDPVAFNAIRAELWRGAFFHSITSELYAVITEMADAGETLNTGNLRMRIGNREPKDLADIAEVLTCNPSKTTGQGYARVVARLARAREGISAGLHLANRLMRSPRSEDADEVISAHIAKLDRTLRAGRGIDLFSLQDCVVDLLDAKSEEGEPAAIATGTPLDEYLGIIALGEYCVLGGRPSMGKSTAIRWLLLELARKGIQVGLIAVEESRQKIAGNYLSSASEVENHLVAHGKLGQDDWKRLLHAGNQLGELPWWGTDSAFSIDQVAAAFESLVLRKRCRVVAVDHLHLIQSDDHHRGDRERELSDISRTLKNLAKKHRVACIAAAQLSRPDKTKAPGLPSLTDLRGSGGIEEHADSVIFIHREDYYRRGELGYDPTDQALFRIAKNRNGQIGSVTLRAELAYQRFAAL